MNTSSQSYKGSMLMVVAPSGAGKSSLVNALLESVHSLQLSLSCTTRDPRAGELDGRDYAFISKEQFLTKRDSGDFMEWAEVHGNLYGTSRSWIESQMQKGSDVILEIDWQGAQQIRQYIPQAIWIFIFPPSIEALEQRLHKRGQDDEQTIAKRVAAAHIELQHAHQADFIVINEIFADALRDLQAIVAASRLCTSPMMARYPALVKRLGA